MAVASNEARRCDDSVAGYSGVAIGRVTDETQEVRDKFRRNAELRRDTIGIADLATPAIDLDYTI